MKARRPPSANQVVLESDWVRVTVVASWRGALHSGMKQEAATACTRCSGLENCEKICGCRLGRGHTCVTVTNRRPLQRDTTSDGRMLLNGTGCNEEKN